MRCYAEECSRAFVSAKGLNSPSALFAHFADNAEYLMMVIYFESGRQRSSLVWPRHAIMINMFYLESGDVVAFTPFEL